MVFPIIILKIRPDVVFFGAFFFSWVVRLPGVVSLALVRDDAAYDLAAVLHDRLHGGYVALGEDAEAVALGSVHAQERREAPDALERRARGARRRKSRLGLRRARRGGRDGARAEALARGGGEDAARAGETRPPPRARI